MRKLSTTVVICTHNRAHLLEECVDSVVVACRLIPRIEILIVDNASTDNTKSVSAALSSRYEQVRVLQEPSLGLSNARNLGLRSSNSDYVIFLDDDGVVGPGWITSLTKPLSTNPDVVGVGGKIEVHFPPSLPPWITPGSLRFYGDYDLGPSEKLVDWVPGGNSAWSRQWLLEMSGFNSKLGRVGKSSVGGSEESEICRLAMDEGKLLLYSPEAKMLHRVQQEKISLLWLLQRYFGQGLMGVRLQDLRGELPEDRKKMLSLIVKTFRSGRPARSVNLEAKSRVTSFFEDLFSSFQKLGRSFGLLTLLIRSLRGGKLSRT